MSITMACPQASVTATALGPVEFHLTAGDGPVVLTSHGGMGGADQARLLLSWLDPSAYRLLSVSRPGYLGTPLEGRETPERQADLFAALLDVLDVPRAAVVTLSSGGPAGYLLAARHPGRVTALVAISSNSGPARPAHNAGPVAQAVFASRLGQWLTSALAARKPAWLVRALLRGESTLAQEDINAQAAHVLRTPATLDWLRSFMTTIYPYRPRKPGTDNDTRQLASLAELPLEDIRCPTLIVHGTHDADVPCEHAATAQQRIGGAQHHWIEHGSHLGFWLNPHADDAQTQAREFLAQHSPHLGPATGKASGADRGGGIPE
jgi:pimeloyl-ACP methyl ester carboxylesterase